MIEEIAVTVAGEAIGNVVGRFPFKAGEIEIGWIQDPTDPMLVDVVDLFEIWIGADRVSSTDDFARWLAEIRQEREDARRHRVAPRLEEYLIYAIEKRTKRLLSAAYFTYYPADRLAFASYLAIDRSYPLAKRAGTTTLLEFLRDRFAKHHPEAEGLIFEVAKDDMKTLAALKHYARDFSFKSGDVSTVFGELDIPYLQPKLSLDDRSGKPEQPQSLVYFGRLHGKQPRWSVSARTARRILKFVYLKIYGDSYDDRMLDPRRRTEYRDYLKQLFDAVVGKCASQSRISLV